MTLCSKTILSVGTSLAVSLVVSSVCVAAEFRTSVRGQSVVRPANFQQPVEELDPMRAPRESPVAGSPEAYSSDWLEPGGEGSCGGACSPPCGSCWTFWGSFEFLLWWRTGQNPPPLVTTSPSDAPAEQAGVLGFPDTDILYTTATQSNDARPGGRLTLGVWLDPCQFHGVVLASIRWGKAPPVMTRAATSFPCSRGPSTTWNWTFPTPC